MLYCYSVTGPSHHMRGRQHQPSWYSSLVLVFYVAPFPLSFGQNWFFAYDLRRKLKLTITDVFLLLASSIYPALPGQCQHETLEKPLKFRPGCPSISFRQPKQLSGSVASTKPHTLPHPRVVNNAHPITWTPYAHFQPEWSINEFLAGIMMSYVSGNDKTTSIDTHTCDQ